MLRLLFHVLIQIARSRHAASPAAPANGVARQLLERAQAGAGRDPHAAQELRSAASAYLSVVR
jgi:hypothetical protein